MLVEVDPKKTIARAEGDLFRDGRGCLSCSWWCDFSLHKFVFAKERESLTMFALEFFVEQSTDR